MTETTIDEIVPKLESFWEKRQAYSQGNLNEHYQKEFNDWLADADAHENAVYERHKDQVMELARKWPSLNVVGESVMEGNRHYWTNFILESRDILELGLFKACEKRLLTVMGIKVKSFKIDKVNWAGDWILFYKEDLGND